MAVIAMAQYSNKLAHLPCKCGVNHDVTYAETNPRTWTYTCSGCGETFRDVDVAMANIIAVRDQTNEQMAALENAVVMLLAIVMQGQGHAP